MSTQLPDRSFPCSASDDRRTVQLGQPEAEFRVGVPKGIPYPDLTGGGQRRLHQGDLVGPRYLQGGTRFYSLHVMDLPTHRVKLVLFW